MFYLKVMKVFVKLLNLINRINKKLQCETVLFNLFIISLDKQ